jgi:hypothetical protein
MTLPKPAPEQIVLAFADKQTADYVRRTVRRKGTTLEGYIVDNFEWDTQLDCITYEQKQITKGMCKDCEYSDKCPDVHP